MDKLSEVVLSQLGFVGVVLIALASYLLKKEVAFNIERQAYLTQLHTRNDKLQERLDAQHKEFQELLRATLTSDVALRQTIADMAQQVARLEATLRQPGGTP